MKAVDDHIPQPERDKDKPFLMPLRMYFQYLDVVLFVQEELKVVSLK